MTKRTLTETIKSFEQNLPKVPSMAALAIAQACVNNVAKRAGQVHPAWQSLIFTSQLIAEAAKHLRRDNEG